MCALKHRQCPDQDCRPGCGASSQVGFDQAPHLKKVWASGLFSISTYQWLFLSKIIIRLSLQYRWYPNVTLVHQTVRLIVYKIPGTGGHRTSANAVQIKQSPAVGCSPGEGRPADISITNTFPYPTIVRNLGVLPRNLAFLLLKVWRSFENCLQS